MALFSIKCHNNDTGTLCSLRVKKINEYEMRSSKEDSFQIIYIMRYLFLIIYHSSIMNIMNIKNCPHDLIFKCLL